MTCPAWKLYKLDLVLINCIYIKYMHKFVNERSCYLQIAIILNDP